MEARLAEPIPLADLAIAVAWSASSAGSSRRAPGKHRTASSCGCERETACRLLRSTTMPIPEVATRCGFSHQERLTRVLRAQSGITPAAVRRAG